MSSAAVSAATEAELISRLLATVDRVNAKSLQLQESINGKIHWLPSGLQERVAEGWNDFGTELNAMWQFWRDVFTHLGSPSALSATADAWSDLGRRSGQQPGPDQRGRPAGRGRQLGR